MLNKQRRSWHSGKLLVPLPQERWYIVFSCQPYPVRGLGHFAVADAATPSRVHICAQGMTLHYSGSMGKKAHNPSHAMALGELRKASRSGAGWWTFEKPSSPTPCLCKQTLVGPFSAPGTSLRNTGDWLQLYLGRARWFTKPAATLFCPLPPCRAGLC